jgi:hypothetical protein
MKVSTAWEQKKTKEQKKEQNCFYFGKIRETKITNSK